MSATYQIKFVTYEAKCKTCGTEISNTIEIESGDGVAELDAVIQADIEDCDFVGDECAACYDRSVTTTPLADIS